VQREAPDLYARACENFGTWETALKYASVRVPRVVSGNAVSPDRVLGKIRYMCRKSSTLSAAACRERDRRLYDSACLHFGTWRRALAAAGINLSQARVRRKPRALDKQWIVAELKRRKDTGQSLVWRDVCFDDHALATAARHAYHGWNRALIAAGLRPEQAVVPGGPLWDREQVIRAIRERHRAGKGVGYADVQTSCRDLYAAAHRYFRNWREAVRAAGLDSDDCGPRPLGK
jgi:hypothetical protein